MEEKQKNERNGIYKNKNKTPDLKYYTN